MRFDLYSLIHKAQRKYLFELSIAIGRTNPSDELQCKNIESQIHDMILLIEDHSKNEEKFIHPLFAQTGHQDKILETEHNNTKEQLENLKFLVKKRDIKALYSAYNRFVASYLEHTDEEERLQAEILWEHFDDQKLMSVMSQFAASKSSQQMLWGLDFMAPALNIQELMRLFGNK